MSHARLIADQFTKQAAGFSKGVPLRDPAALQRIVKLSGVSSSDSVLDLGCGPGIVACAFARVARTVVGIDATDAMLETAAREAQSQGLGNVRFARGDLYHSDLPDASFDVVSTRFVVHHLQRPQEAVAEMARLARRVVVLTDVTPLAQRQEALNSLELLRDPSHVRFHTQLELVDMLVKAGLKNPRAESYRVPSPLSEWLARSYFATPADRAEFVRRIADDVERQGGSHHDLALVKADGDVQWSHMVSILVAHK